MTDKVQKIREEVVRLHKLLPVMDGDNISVDYADRICTTLETYIDSMQGKQVDYCKLQTSLDNALAKETKESWEKFLQEEQVSEGLEEAAIQFATDTETGKVDVVKQGSFFWGAQWKEQQFEKNRLKHCDSITNEQAELEQGFIDQHLDKHQRMPTYLDAVEYGMKLQKEQMMTSATDVTVHVDAGGYPYVPQIELYDYDKDIPLAKEGDKYKMVLIKED